MDRVFALAATRFAALAGQPFAFIGAGLLILLWVATGLIFGIGIGHLTDNEIEGVRHRLEEQVGTHPPGRRRADSVGRLLGRR